MLQKFKQHRAISNDLSRFAETNDFVVFGKLKNDDHIERIRGATFSPHAKDDNYMHTNINGYEVSFFTRSSEHASREQGIGSYDWSVVSIELKVHSLPHAIFDNKKHDKRFYNSVFTRYPKLRVANQALALLNISAEQNFDLYMAPENIFSLANVFSDEILQRMALYYGKFDIEVTHDRLNVFVRNLPINYMQLKEMLEESLWLAERLEMRATYARDELNSDTTEALSLVTT